MASLNVNLIKLTYGDIEAEIKISNYAEMYDEEFTLNGTVNSLSVSYNKEELNQLIKKLKDIHSSMK